MMFFYFTTIFEHNEAALKKGQSIVYLNHKILYYWLGKSEGRIMDLERVTIIIPTYNESAGIQRTILEVFAHTKDNDNYKIDILVFDSASIDNTVEQVKALKSSIPNLILRSEPKKTGLGSAYLQAMNFALHKLQADIIIEFDADLSHQPKYINCFLKVIKSCDVVVGSRYINGGSIPDDWSWHRKILSIIGNYITRLFLTNKYKDFTTGFRATRREHLIKALPIAFISNAYAYKIELLWRLHKNKASILEYPIDFIDRKQGYSKLPTNSILDTLRVLLILRFYKLRIYSRMCAVGAVGVCVQLLIYNISRHYFDHFHATQISVLAAILNNYILNYRITFKHPSWTFFEKLQSFGFFFSYSLAMIYAQSYWLSSIITLIGASFGKENFVMLIGIIIGSMLNYLVYSRFIWQQHKAPPIGN